MTDRYGLWVFGLILVPTAIGVAIRHRFPALARRLNKPVRIAAAVLLVLVSLGAVAGGKTTIWSYLAPRRLHLPPRQSIAVSLEIGLHNAMLAMGIALSPQLLNSTEMATPAAVYGFFAPAIALAFVFIVRRVDPAFKKEAAPATDDNVGAEAATVEFT